MLLFWKLFTSHFYTLVVIPSSAPQFTDASGVQICSYLNAAIQPGVSNNSVGMRHSLMIDL